MQKFYSKLDLCIFFTDADVSGLIPFESMACKVPIVASCKYYGLYDMLKNSNAVYIQNNHNLEDMSKEIEMLVANPNIYRQRVDAGSKLVALHFISPNSPIKYPSLV